MDDESGEIQPGFYTYSGEERGAAAAEVEQKRAEIIDVLRTSKCFTLSILDDEGGVLHSTFVIGLETGDEKPFVFLSYACLKLINDLAQVLDVDMERTVDLLREMVQNGAGEEWS